MRIDPSWSNSYILHDSCRPETTSSYRYVCQDMKYAWTQLTVEISVNSCDRVPLQTGPIALGHCSRRNTVYGEKHWLGCPDVWLSIVQFNIWNSHSSQKHKCIQKGEYPEDITDNREQITDNNTTFHTVNKIALWRSIGQSKAQATTSASLNLLNYKTVTHS